MKKLLLAPAVALAFTGLVAAPVAAAETPSTSASAKAEAKAEAEQDKADKLAKEKAEQAAEEKAEKEKKEKAEEAEQKKADAKKAADKKAADRKTADKKAGAKKKADEKSGDDKKSKKPAPKDDGSKDSKKDNGSDAKDDDKSKDSKVSEDPKGEVEKIDASLNVETSKVAAEDLADSAKGVKVTVSGLEKGDKITATGLKAPATTATSSTATLRLHYSGNPKTLQDGKQNFSLKVAREGAPTTTLSGATQVEALAADKADPEVTPSATTITKEELSDEGLDITGTGFTEDSSVIFMSQLGEAGGTDSDADGNIDANFKPELQSDFKPGVYTVTIFDGFSETADNFDLRVTEDGEADPIDASLELDPKEITAEDLVNKDKGVTATVSGVKKGDKITDSLTGETKTVDTDGDYKLNLYYKGDASDLQEGKEPFKVDIAREGTKSVTLNGEINIVDDEDAVDPIDTSLKVDPKEITAEDLATKDKGVTVTVSGVKEGDKITDSLTDKAETAEADGDYKLHLYYKGNPKNLEEGKVPFTVTIDRDGTDSQTLKGNINVVAEDKEDGDDGDNGDTPEAPAEASFTVSPKTLEAADFANDKKGVTLAVENCEPGADVHFMVTPKGIQVTAYENTVMVDDEGNASVNVFGTSDNVSAYVGSYTASATCGDDTMKESFKVTEGANGGGSDGNDNDGDGNNGSDDGSQLPRTGADLGGLASGAILLLVGGAAIAMTGRRKKVGQSPTDF